ncbi:MAG: hypothetical protein QHH06_04855 [Clostridiales bacterium]|nr:hypothetical protein [Eubacteriales bacterium]MDH7565797.1 hypothetical protein [Clostridiales bacterium]
MSITDYADVNTGDKIESAACFKNNKKLLFSQTPENLLPQDTQEKEGREGLYSGIQKKS